MPPRQARWFLATLLCLASRAGAETLSLSDCLRLARDNAPDALEGRFNESQALKDRDAARSQLLPDLSALGSVTGTDDVLYAPVPDNATGAALDVRFSGFPYTQSWALKEQKESDLKAAGYSRQVAEEGVAFAVKELYFSVLQDSDAIKNLDRVENELDRLRETVAPRYTVGRVPPFDSVKVRAALSDLARSREDAETRLAGETARLAAALGLDDGAALELKPVAAVPEMPETSQAAMQANPGELALRERVSGAERAVDGAQYARYPAWYGDFQYGYAGLKPNDVSLGYVATLGLRLSLFDWGTISAQVDSQKRAVDLARNHAKAESQGLLAQWREASSEARARLADLKRLQDLLPDAREASDNSIERYRHGAAGILEAADAVNLWLQTLLEERSAYYAYLTALARLEELSGGQVRVSYE